LRPEIGDFIKINYYSSNDKKSKKTKINILKVELTSEIKSSLLKNTTGEYNATKYLDNKFEI
jgi:hypothetical protein